MADWGSIVISVFRLVNAVIFIWALWQIIMSIRWMFAGTLGEVVGFAQTGGPLGRAAGSAATSWLQDKAENWKRRKELNRLKKLRIQEKQNRVRTLIHPDPSTPTDPATAALIKELVDEITAIQVTLDQGVVHFKGTAEDLLKKIEKAVDGGKALLNARLVSASDQRLRGMVDRPLAELESRRAELATVARVWPSFEARIRDWTASYQQIRGNDPERTRKLEVIRNAGRELGQLMVQSGSQLVAFAQSIRPSLEELEQVSKRREKLLVSRKKSGAKIKNALREDIRINRAVASDVKQIQPKLYALQDAVAVCIKDAENVFSLAKSSGVTGAEFITTHVDTGHIKNVYNRLTELQDLITALQQHVTLQVSVSKTYFENVTDGDKAAAYISAGLDREVHLSKLLEQFITKSYQLAVEIVDNVKMAQTDAIPEKRDRRALVSHANVKFKELISTLQAMAKVLEDMRSTVERAGRGEEAVFRSVDPAAVDTSG